PGQEVGGLHLQHPEVLIVAAAGICIVFSLWWLYFSRSAASTLTQFRSGQSKQSYLWGYGHYLIFASAAAIGAGLGVRIDYWNQDGHVSARASGALVTVSIAVLLAMIWVLHLRYHDSSWRTLLPFGSAILIILAGTFTPVPELVAAAACVALLIIEVRVAHLVGTEE
ncbi:MAG TPA: low temperature requirement protein A, partial [Microlunatus sp.]